MARNQFIKLQTIHTDSNNKCKNTQGEREATGNGKQLQQNAS